MITGAAFTGIRNLSAGNGGSTTLSGTLTTTGHQTFHDDVTLAANTTLDAGTGSILLAGVVSGGFALTPLTSGSGTTTLRIPDRHVVGGVSGDAAEWRSGGAAAARQ